VGGGDAADAQPAVRGDARIEVRARPPAPPPRRRIVDCKVTAIKPAKKGNKGMVVHASCPANSGVTKGARGQLFDPKTKLPYTHGLVVVTEVKKNKVVGSAAALKSKVKATKLRFRVRRY